MRPKHGPRCRGDDKRAGARAAALPRRIVTVVRRRSGAIVRPRPCKDPPMRLAARRSPSASPPGSPPAAARRSPPASGVAAVDAARRLARARRQPRRRARDRARARLAHLLAGAGRGRHPAALRLVGLGEPRARSPTNGRARRSSSSFGMRSYRLRRHAGAAGAPDARTTRRRRSSSRSTSSSGSATTSACRPRPRLAARLAPDAAEQGRARIEAALADRPQSAAEAGVTARRPARLAPTAAATS